MCIFGIRSRLILKNMPSRSLNRLRVANPTSLTPTDPESPGTNNEAAREVNPDSGTEIDAEPVSKRELLAYKLDELKETFATDELMEELSDNASLGRRGEIIFVAQLIVTLLVVFPPMRLQGLVYMAGASHPTRILTPPSLLTSNAAVPCRK